MGRLLLRRFQSVQLSASPEPFDRHFDGAPNGEAADDDDDHQRHEVDEVQEGVEDDHALAFGRCLVRCQPSQWSQW